MRCSAVPISASGSGGASRLAFEGGEQLLCQLGLVGVERHVHLERANLCAAAGGGAAGMSTRVHGGGAVACGRGAQRRTMA